MVVLNSVSGIGSFVLSRKENFKWRAQLIFKHGAKRHTIDQIRVHPLNFSRRWSAFPPQAQIYRPGQKRYPASCSAAR